MRVVQGPYFEQQGTLTVFLSIVSGQAAPASPGILLEMQIIRLHMRTYMDRVPAVCDLTRPPGDSDAHSSLRIDGQPPTFPPM